MTLDEDAASVAQQVIDCVDNMGDWFDKEHAVEAIAAFGRRCAEAMREECVALADDGSCDCRRTLAEAIKRVEIT